MFPFLIFSDSTESSRRLNRVESWNLRIVLPLIVGSFLLPLSNSAQEKKKERKLPDGVTIVQDIEYATPNGQSLKLDLYLPKTPKRKKLPVVLWIHGGGWVQGSKKNCKSVYLAADGDFAAVSVGYRLVDAGQWPDQINDCYEAVRWVRRNAERYGLDPDKIGVWGGSAGGHLAALVGTRPADKTADKETVSAKVQAVCDWFGPSDLLTMPPNTISEKRTRAMVEKSNGARLLGKTVMDVPDLAKDASALYHATGDDPPFLIMHGDADKSVPLEQSEKLHAALQKAGVESELVILKGAGHAGKPFYTPETFAKIRAFFVKNLIETE